MSLVFAYAPYQFGGFDMVGASLEQNGKFAFVLPHDSGVNLLTMRDKKASIQR